MLEDRRKPMSRWECNSGHVLEGLFYVPLPSGDPVQMPEVVKCPRCHCDMVLARTEGAIRFLTRIREFIGEVSKDPRHELDGSQALADLGRLEAAVKKMSDEVLRP